MSSKSKKHGPSSAELQRLVDNLWTAQRVCAEYNVTPMTVHLWRMRKPQGLPAVVIPSDARPAVRFVPYEVAAWYNANIAKSTRTSA